MTWILIAYLATLIYFTTRGAVSSNPPSLRLAWLFFAGIPLSHFFFTLVRAANFSDSRDLALTETWADGIAWLLLGISMVFLVNVLAPRTEPAPPAL